MMKIEVDNMFYSTATKEGGWLSLQTSAAGGYERQIEDGKTRHLYYISGADGMVAICKKEDNNKQFYYVHKDHLGSPHVITGENKEVQARYYYDVWGHRYFVNKENGNELSGQNDLSWMQRGFTGHEHIKELDLINMSSEVRSRTLYMSGNGRMFDPLLGRFLSPDPYVQSPDRTKNFNRYAYAINNPLMFTDPSGESFGLFMAGITLWAAGHTLQSEYAYGNVNQTWGKVGGVMKFGGSVMLSSSMPTPVGAGAMGFMTTKMNGGSLGQAAISCGISAGISSIPYLFPHCEYIYDINTGEKEMISHLGNGKYNFTAYGEWVDDHSAFVVYGNRVTDLPLGGTENWKALSRIVGSSVSNSVGSKGAFVSNLLPAARGYSINFSQYTGGGLDASAGLVLLLQGPHAGSLLGTGDIGYLGGGLDMLELTVQETNYWWTGDLHNFTRGRFEGKRTELNASLSLGADVGLSGSWTKLDKGGRIIGIGGTVGVSATPTVVSGNLNYGYTGYKHLGNLW